MVIEVKQGDKFVKIPYMTADVPVTEAPEDGKQYARKDAAWSEIDFTEVDNKINTKVDKVEGKQLSANDYTTDEKTKLADLPIAGDIVINSDIRLTPATESKAGIMTAADKVQLDSTLTATEIENKVNAAVSSVYRVKGTIATVADLPIANVAVGDVYNIEEDGSNYVAIEINPIQWDKLSETIDLSPYLQTSIANSTFAKKAGDTFTGNIKINTLAASNLEFDINNTSIGSVGADADSIFLHNLVRNKNLKYTNDGKLLFESIPVMLTNGSTPITEEQDIVKDGNATIRFKDSDGTIRGYVGKIANLDSIPVEKIGIWLRNGKADKTLMLRDDGSLTYNDNKVWHAGNDGVGSGLDADTLDGLQGIDYARFYNLGSTPDAKGAYILIGPAYTDTAVNHCSLQGILIGVRGNKTAFNIASTAIVNISAAYTQNYGNIVQLLSAANTPIYYPCLVTYNNNRYLAIEQRAFASIQMYFSGFFESGDYDLKQPSIVSANEVSDIAYIKQSDVIIAGKGSNEVLTQAEYDALGSSVNSDNKIYFIKE